MNVTKQPDSLTLLILKDSSDVYPEVHNLTANGYLDTSGLLVSKIIDSDLIIVRASGIYLELIAVAFSGIALPNKAQAGSLGLVCKHGNSYFNVRGFTWHGNDARTIAFNLSNLTPEKGKNEHK